MFAKPSKPMLNKRYFKIFFILTSLVVVLTACGFKLKGTTDLPFNTLSTNINMNSEFGSNLLRSLKATSPDTIFVGSGKPADAVYKQINVQRTKKEMSLDIDGRVEEYELSLIYQFSLEDSAGNVLLPPTQIVSHQLMPYDEDQSAADNEQISFLYRDMEKGLVDKIIRYISSERVIKRYQRLHPSGQ